MRRCPTWPALIQPLGQQHRARAVEPQHFDDVAAPAVEGEDVALERVFGRSHLHQCSQDVEAFAHVCRCCRSRSTPAWPLEVRSFDLAPASVRSTERTQASLTTPCKRTRTPLMSISMVPAGAAHGGELYGVGTKGAAHQSVGAITRSCSAPELGAMGP